MHTGRQLTTNGDLTDRRRVPAVRRGDVEVGLPHRRIGTLDDSDLQHKSVGPNGQFPLIAEVPYHLVREDGRRTGALATGAHMFNRGVGRDAGTVED